MPTTSNPSVRFQSNASQGPAVVYPKSAGGSKIPPNTSSRPPGMSEKVPHSAVTRTDSRSRRSGRSRSRSRRRRNSTGETSSRSRMRRTSSSQSGSPERRSRRSRSRRTHSSRRQKPTAVTPSQSPKPTLPSYPLPMCPDDLLCENINNQSHQLQYRHTCRLPPCEYMWMESHCKLFSHDPPPVSTTSSLVIPQQPGKAVVVEQPCGSCGMRSPLRPPVAEVDGEVFSKRDRSERREVSVTDDLEELESLRKQTRLVENRLGIGTSRIRPPLSADYFETSPTQKDPKSGRKTLSDVDSILKGRLEGFTLVKEIENLCMEVRTLRHLHHFRHALASQNDVGTVAYQVDHSIRRVEASVRRVRYLQREIDPTDLLQARADDEVAFAVELLNTIESGSDKKSGYRGGPAHNIPDPYDAGGPRLIHSSVSAAAPVQRNIGTPRD